MKVKVVRQTDRQTGGEMKRNVNNTGSSIYRSTIRMLKKIQRETDRLMNRVTNQQTDRQLQTINRQLSCILSIKNMVDDDDDDDDDDDVDKSTFLERHTGTAARRF